MAKLPTFDNCEVLERSERGPVTETFHAVQHPLGRHVQVKTLSASILPSSPFAATLEREARLLAELHHPNILRIHDFVRRDDRMWIVLEYVEGWRVGELLKKHEKLATDAAVAIALEVARALEHAHARGIIHRDVQPNNVLVTQSGRVKLTNFAVAVDERLPTAPELLDSSNSLGGPVYMSPEQILGEPANPRSDQFSLGMMLYEMIAGQRPFQEPDDRSATQRIRHESAPPLATRGKKVPGALERIVRRCLEKLPNDRYDSTTALCSELEVVLHAMGRPSSQQTIGETLVELGWIDEVAPETERTVPRASPSPRSLSLLQPLAGLAFAAVLIAAGGGVLAYMSQPESAGAHTARRQPVVPENAGYLRVVAEPWAQVFVDGQHIDTTPFARSLALAAGVHYVRLEHPNAPPERRTVRLAQGETVLLDVKMQVVLEPVSPPLPPPAPSASGLAIPESSGGSRAAP